MPLILFTRALQTHSPESLVELARRLQIDGYDLCVRPGHPVTPENAGEKLPRTVALFRQHGLAVPLVTAPTDLITADDPRATAILPAMDQADVRLLKIGYFRYDPAHQGYPDAVQQARRQLADWEKLARQHRVKICYHTHSGGFLGLNGAGLAHLLEGFDPACLGAYLDPGHLVIDGEQFPAAIGMVQDHLAAVALKDVLVTRREQADHGAQHPHWVKAGQGMVDWTTVAGTLRAAAFHGPLSVHAEFESTPAEFPAALAREAAFFRRVLVTDD